MLEKETGGVTKVIHGSKTVTKNDLVAVEDPAHEYTRITT
jgi:hypothetical protein